MCPQCLIVSCNEAHWTACICYDIRTVAQFQFVTGLGRLTTVAWRLLWEPADKWQQMYHAALLELDPTHVEAACERALAEIEFRRVTGEKDGTITDASRREL